ncbi:hypothetical protein EVA_02489 [gut metagenome]|uniref:Uncharacterized protein n=1 Tax=gut metagenome TaxID=749906 RepID=J9D982_9ZZZZ
MRFASFCALNLGMPVPINQKEKNHPMNQEEVFRGSPLRANSQRRN